MIKNSISDHTIIAFTDGSCRGNPGPSGAGSYVLLPNSDAVELKQSVSTLASILLGELVAIKLTLNFVIEENRKHEIDTVLIFCDSQSAVGILQLGWDNKSQKKLIWTFNSL